MPQTTETDRGMDAYRRYLDGDDGGLTQIIDEYGDSLLRYIRTFVPDEMTAEDILSETFLKLIVRRPQFRGESLFKTYLFAIGRHEALRRVKRTRREVPLGEWMPTRQAADAHDTVVTIERRRVLHAAMADIAPQYREALYLVYFEDLSCREAAAVLHKSSKQTANLLFRGKQALKTVLEKEGIRYEDI